MLEQLREDLKLDDRLLITNQSPLCCTRKQKEEKYEQFTYLQLMPVAIQNKTIVESQHFRFYFVAASFTCWNAAFRACRNLENTGMATEETGHFYTKVSAKINHKFFKVNTRSTTECYGQNLNASHAQAGGKSCGSCR